MSKRFDAGNLLRADSLVAKADRPRVLTPEELEQTNLCVRIPVKLSARLKITAIEQRTTVRALVIEALHAAGVRE